MSLGVGHMSEDASAPFVGVSGTLRFQVSPDRRMPIPVCTSGGKPVAVTFHSLLQHMVWDGGCWARKANTEWLLAFVKRNRAQG